MNNRSSEYMLFSCGEHRYAVEVAAVDEISEILPLFPVPDRSRFLLGVVNIHGKLAAVIDLSMYLGAGPVKNSHNLLLLKLPETGLAFMVTQVEKIISRDEIIATEPGTSEFEKATFILPDGNVTLLELASLVDSIEKAIAA